MAADEQLRAQAARTIDRNVATFTFRLRLPKDQTLLGNAVFGHREAQMAIDAEHRRVRMTSDRQLSAAATTAASVATGFLAQGKRSEEHTSELQSLMRISYAVFCLTKKKQYNVYETTPQYTL